VAKVRYMISWWEHTDNRGNPLTPRRPFKFSAGSISMFQGTDLTAFYHYDNLNDVVAHVKRILRCIVQVGGLDFKFTSQDRSHGRECIHYSTMMEVMRATEPGCN